jgi:hypothetical protein
MLAQKAEPGRDSNWHVRDSKWEVRDQQWTVRENSWGVPCRTR